MARIGDTAGDGCPTLGDHLLGWTVLFGDGVELADGTANAVGLGLADGANVRVNKMLGEVVLGDLLRQPDVAFAVGKAASDGAELSDGVVKAIDKILSEVVELSDGRVMDVGVGIDDGVLLGEGLDHVWAIYKALTDGVGLSDAEALVVANVLTLKARSLRLTAKER